MKLKILIIPGLLFLTCMLNAQPDFRPGYIVKISGDTLYGTIDYRGDKLMGNICTFINKDNSLVEYTPNDILAFRFADSKYFVSKEIKNRKVFLEYLINGKINVYYLRDKLGDHYYVEKENEKIAELPFSEGTILINYVRKYYESKNHTGMLIYLTQDAPELKTRIQNMKKPNHQNLVKLAEDYHHSVCKDEPCIVYQKKVPLLSISVQPVVGTTIYLDYYRVVNEVGSYVYIWAPRTNENFFFKTGVKYLRIAEEGLVLQLYKMPIQIQYIYRAYRLQPSISGGTNFLKGRIENFKDFGHTFCMNAGLNFQITNSTSLCAGIDFDFTPFSGIIFDDYKFKLLSYSVDVGLRIDL